MRKAALLLSVIMFLSCLAGCGEETKTKGESVSSVVFETASSHYSYPQKGLNSFDVAGDGRVFCSLESENNSLKLSASQANQNAVLMAAMDANKAEILRRTGAECPTAAYIVQPPQPVTFPTNCCGQAQFGGCGSF